MLPRAKTTAPQASSVESFLCPDKDRTMGSPHSNTASSWISIANAANITPWNLIQLSRSNLRTVRNLWFSPDWTEVQGRPGRKHAKKGRAVTCTKCRSFHVRSGWTSHGQPCTGKPSYWHSRYASWKRLTDQSPVMVKLLLGIWKCTQEEAEAGFLFGKDTMLFGFAKKKGCGRYGQR